MSLENMEINYKNASHFGMYNTMKFGAFRHEKLPHLLLLTSYFLLITYYLVHAGRGKRAVVSFTAGDKKF